MQFVKEFRDQDTALRLADRITQEVQTDRVYTFMEFCGGHTHAIARYAIGNLLPSQIRLSHGPGCPICVLPTNRVDLAIAIAANPDVILCTYGDVLRIPGSHKKSLLSAKATGADVRVVYSAMDALTLAKTHPERRVVFFAVGFETTTPPTAIVLQQAKIQQVHNFSVVSNHLLTVPAVSAILATPGTPINGIIGPAHVSTVIGSEAFQGLAQTHQMTIVIAGFEPLDILQAIFMLVQQVNADDYKVENQFIRGVTASGNSAAQGIIETVFERREQFEWRGIGTLPNSGLCLRPEFHAWDAEQQFPPVKPSANHVNHCACGDILRGRAEPQDCPLFGLDCTPENPVGACMVSSEGACAAEWSYGKARHKR